MEYYHGNINLPVYGHPRRGYNCEEIVHILLDPVFTDGLLSTTHPVSVEHVSFVINLKSLSNPNLTMCVLMISAHGNALDPDILPSWLNLAPLLAILLAVLVLVKLDQEEAKCKFDDSIMFMGQILIFIV